MKKKWKIFIKRLDVTPWNFLSNQYVLIELTLPHAIFSVSPNQIIRLFTRFTSLDKEQNGKLTREAFLRIPELAINPIADRIVESFFDKGWTQISDFGHCISMLNGSLFFRNDSVNFRQFMRTLAVFRPISTKTPEDAINGRNKKLECKDYYGIHLGLMSRPLTACNVKQMFWTALGIYNYAFTFQSFSHCTILIKMGKFQRKIWRRWVCVHIIPNQITLHLHIYVYVSV